MIKSGPVRFSLADIGGEEGNKQSSNAARLMVEAGDHASHNLSRDADIIELGYEIYGDG